MKELLLRAARYNAWANDHFIQLLVTLSDEELDMEITSSFPSIRKTVMHIWGAEDIWLQRFESVQQPVWKPGTYSGNIISLCDEWRIASAELIRFTGMLKEEAEFSRVVTGLNLKGEPFADVLSAGLKHVFNHSTYHRGQLVTMLRQAGVSAIPQTDLIHFARQTA
jgi:uncharacterized damage-inducible protein DinB